MTEDHSTNQTNAPNYFTSLHKVQLSLYHYQQSFVKLTDALLQKKAANNKDSALADAIQYKTAAVNSLIEIQNLLEKKMQSYYDKKKPVAEKKEMRELEKQIEESRLLLTKIHRSIASGKDSTNMTSYHYKKTSGIKIAEGNPASPWIANKRKD